MSTTEVTTASTGRVLRPRPNNKSSIRQSLNLASVGKALADVMHKDAKDTQGDKEKLPKEKLPKKTKETGSRRGSLVPRPASEKDAGGIAREKSSSPEVKAGTKNSRRMSGLPKLAEVGTTSSEESSSPATRGQKSTIGRSHTLRPKNSTTGNASGLPKYRPKSALIETTSGVKKPPSPARLGIRRKLSCSDEDKEDKGKPGLRLAGDAKLTRAISPLPHRGALQVNLTSAINVRPATPEKAKTGTPTPQSSPARLRTTPMRPSPSRVKKPAKAAAPASTSSAPPSRPSSAGSSRAPPSPTTPSATQRHTLKPNSSKAVHKRSPLSSIFSSQQDSPLADVVARRKAQNSSPSPLRTPSSLINATPIILTEESSMDSIDAQDVELMLSSIVSPTAPTPALPRIRASFLNDEPDPQTPSRSTFTTRPNMSYLSTTQPDDDSPFLRLKTRSISTADRNSILSWEQFASHNRSMGEEEVESMLTVDAPFQPGALSPALSSLTELPESPSLSAMPSPTGYGSISQVLLPDVTPSPAIHNAALRFDEFAAETPPRVDSGAITLMRLQLASLENVATERLTKIEYLEAQLQAAREARLRDTEELANQISVLEEQVKESLRPDEQLTQQVASLEEQLQHAQTAQDQAVREALKRSEAEAKTSRADALQEQQTRWHASSAACKVASAWRTVHNAAEGELELIRSNLETLAVLSAGLAQYQQAL